MTIPLDERLAALLSALDKLPPHHGLSYRGYTGRPFTLDQLKDQMTEAIRDARGRPPVDAPTPGKFSGPLA